jgi:hypothetical protein
MPPELRGHVGILSFQLCAAHLHPDWTQVRQTSLQSRVLVMDNELPYMILFLVLSIQYHMSAFLTVEYYMHIPTL